MSRRGGAVSLQDSRPPEVPRLQWSGRSAASGLPALEPSPPTPEWSERSTSVMHVFDLGPSETETLQQLTPRTPCASCSRAADSARPGRSLTKTPSPQPTHRATPREPRGGAEDILLIQRLERLLESHVSLLQGPWLSHRLEAAQRESTRQIEAALQLHTGAILARLGGPPVGRLWSSEEEQEEEEEAGAGAAAGAEVPATPMSMGEVAVDGVATPSQLPDDLEGGASGTEPRHETGEQAKQGEPARCSGSDSRLSGSNLFDWHKSEKRERRTVSARLRKKTPMLSRAVSTLLELQRYVEEEPEKNVERNDCTRIWFAHFEVPFDYLCMGVIVAHISWVVHTTNDEIINPSNQRSNNSFVVDLSFTAFYSVELFLRIYTQREYFFFGANKYWHLFDCLLVLASLLLDTGIGFLRALRALRAVKVVRAVKIIQYFKSGALEIMVNCLTGSLNMVFWCTLMIAFFTFLFSVFFVQSITQHLIDSKQNAENFDAESLDNFYQWFGSVQTGMLSLLMITTGGVDWSDVYEVVGPTGWIASAVFVFYIMLFTIAVWNVVTSTFVDKALKLAKPSDDTVIMEARLQAQHDAKELRATFRRMDLDHSGHLDYREFTACMKRPEFERWLQTRGLDIKDTRLFFKMLARNQPYVDIETIVNACLRMRGFATSVDLHVMRYELRKIQQTIKRHVIFPEDAGTNCPPDFGERDS